MHYEDLSYLQYNLKWSIFIAAQHTILNEQYVVGTLGSENFLFWEWVFML